MEGSESEAIFESLNLKPQLFINQVLNSIDDLVDGAFDFFHREASEILNTDGTDRAADLKQSVDDRHRIIQATLGKRLEMWEKYCLRHCFTLPSSFSLSDPNEVISDFPMEDVFGDESLDVQLDSLRNKHIEVAKESDELNLQIRTLERQSSLSKSVDACVNEVLQRYDENHVAFQEMIGAASELRERMEKLRTSRLNESEQNRRDKVYTANGDDFSVLNSNKGLFGARLVDLEAFLLDMKNI